MIKRAKTLTKDAANASYKNLRAYIRGMDSTQWNKLKNYLRTGEVPEGLSHEILAKFTEMVFRYKEASAGMLRPMRGRFDANTKKVLRTQAEAFVKIFYPRQDKDAKERLVKTILAKTKKIGWRQVEQAARKGTPEELLSHGQMYLDAIDPKHRERVAREILGRKNPPRSEKKISLGRPLGLVHKETKDIILAADWPNDLFAPRFLSETAAIHEMAHMMLGANEEGAMLTEMYYALKRGIVNSTNIHSYLTRYQDISMAMNIQTQMKMLGIARIYHNSGPVAAEKYLRKLVKNSAQQ
ncbi:MAG: hypothetical protein NUV67_01235 [archaeon]|nr:hypothetical protein [archaeon]